MPTRVQFATAVLQGLQAAGHEAPVTTSNLDGLVAQQVAENTTAEFNPMATEEIEPGDTDFNSAGVKDYPTMEEGVAASVATLVNGRYPRTLDAIAKGNSAVNIANAWASEPWGTENFTSTVEEVQTNRQAFYDENINGTTNATETDQPPAWGSEELSIEDGGESLDVVKELQSFYNTVCNQHLAVDGYYGTATEAATKNFQIIMRLAVDGIVGPQTWEAIKYVDAMRNGNSALAHGQG